LAYLNKVICFFIICLLINLKNKKIMQMVLAILVGIIGIGTANNTQGWINGSNHTNANGIENCKCKGRINCTYIPPPWC
jgi:hypothetical protein